MKREESKGRKGETGERSKGKKRGRMSGEGREDKEKPLKTEEKIRINYKEGTGRKGEEQIKQKKRNESKREKTHRKGGQ